MKWFILLTVSLNVFSFDHTHKLWDDILKSHVKVVDKQALFNYKKLKESPEKLNQYLASLSAVSISDYGKFLSNERIAFFINAYNAFTVKLIIDHYPVKSIKKIGSLFKSAWKQEFFTLLGKKMHLDNIEHDILREKFNEPRIHFAIVCASISCPNIVNFAITSPTLEGQFQKLAKSFLLEQGKNSFNKEEGELELSKIFKWFGDDFVKKYGSYKKYVAKVMEIDPAKIKDIDFNSYDWNLNEWK